MGQLANDVRAALETAIEARSDALAQEAMSGIRYQDENGQTVEEDLTVLVDGEEVTVSPMTQADLDAFQDYCAGSSGAAGGSEDLRERARSALKQVLEEGADPQTAAAELLNP